MAVCIECTRDLPVEDFAVDKRNKTGRRGVCRACVRARYAARYRDKSKEYYQRNADKLRALTMDHVVPLTRGGWHDPINVVPACQSCNSKKHDKTLIEFLAPELLTR